MKSADGLLDERNWVGFSVYCMSRADCAELLEDCPLLGAWLSGRCANRLRTRVVCAPTLEAP